MELSYCSRCRKYKPTPEPFKTCDECRAYIKATNAADKEKHRERVAAYKLEHADAYKKVIECECGSTYTYQHKWKHVKTQRHITWQAKR